MSKELHNQTLITSITTDLRLAIGEPGQTGCNNIKPDVLLGLFLKYGKDESVILGDNTITLSSAFSDADYVIFIRTTNGTGYSITSQAAGSFVVNFLGSDTIDYLCIKI